MKHEEINVPRVLIVLYNAQLSRYPVPKIKKNEKLKTLQVESFFV